MSTQKSNKSYLKRIKVTKNGKLVARKPGQNHFNAKASGAQRMNKRRAISITMTKRDRNRFLPHN